jgi:hypothetical protein
MVKSGGILSTRDFSTVLVLVEVFDSTMDAEVDGFLEALDMGCPVGTCVLLDANAACMDDGHGRPSLSWRAVKLTV